MCLIAALLHLFVHHHAAPVYHEVCSSALYTKVTGSNGEVVKSRLCLYTRLPSAEVQKFLNSAI
jgi:hypothetical protein